MKRTLLAALALCLAAPVASAIPPDHAPAHGRREKNKNCTDGENSAVRFDLPAGGDRATGHYALPDRAPDALVVFAHGYGHTSYSWTHHMQRISSHFDAVTVAMDYRGTEIVGTKPSGVPDSRGWPAQAGAEDLVAAARFFQEKCRSVRRTILLGVSMGGNMSGLAAAIAPGVFDQWIDVEGAVNVTETYLEASGVALSGNATAVNAQEDIEAEMGGTFFEVPETYAERSVVTRAEEIAANVKGVTIIHGLDDGLVPYNQSRELAALLAAQGEPLDFFTITRRSADSEQETTASGYAGGALCSDYRSPLAGHASEMSTTHIVMTTAFGRLEEMLGGYAPADYADHVVDGEWTPEAPQNCG
jgi:dipeptidyl aminopeptidase/acylaminoacyl peptidase